MKSFLLCVGAQKSGTSWLHSYLSSLDGVDLGFAKEYRTFDPHPPAVQLRRRLQALRELIQASFFNAGASPETRQARFLLNRRFYYDYFAELLKQPNVIVTGDFSPAYSGLQAAAFREIRDNFAERGIAVRPVFLMRDPVERCWSAVRMERRNFVERPHRRKGVTERQMALTEEQHLLELYRVPRFTAMTRYDRTIGEIEKVFEPGAPIYAFFEQLFTDETIGRICGELGLDYAPPSFERPVNVSEKKIEISDSAKAEIARFYEPVYAFAARRYGEDLIRRIWPNYRFVA